MLYLVLLDFFRTVKETEFSYHFPIGKQTIGSFNSYKNIKV